MSNLKKAVEDAYETLEAIMPPKEEKKYFTSQTLEDAAKSQGITK